MSQCMTVDEGVLFVLIVDTPAALHRQVLTRIDCAVWASA
jgi:hypothetical protein